MICGCRFCKFVKISSLRRFRLNIRDGWVDAGLGNTKVGDMADIIVGEKVGVVLSDFNADSIREAVEELVCLAKQEGIQVHCRDVALKYFSLKEGVRSYDRIYRELMV